MSHSEQNYDTLFLDDTKANAAFRFDKATVAVFENMIERSVPFYIESQRMITEISVPLLDNDAEAHHLDLGCSLGTTIYNIASNAKSAVTFTGIDNSQDMLEKATKNIQSKLPPKTNGHTISFIKQDLAYPDLAECPPTTVATLVYTLQFIKPSARHSLLTAIHSNLKKNGRLIIFEKIAGQSTESNNWLEKNYHAFKERNGYSKKEILNKKKALENVLCPLTIDENIQLLKKARFSLVQPIFQWYNFAGFLAVK